MKTVHATESGGSTNLMLGAMLQIYEDFSDFSDLHTIKIGISNRGANLVFGLRGGALIGDKVLIGGGALIFFF